MRRPITSRPTAVRAFVLVVLRQLLRAPAEAAGYALQPASAQARLARALLDTLDLTAMPTTGHVVAADPEQVTLDLAPVPLDEVLDFRRQHATSTARTPATSGSSSATLPR